MTELARANVDLYLSGSLATDVCFTMAHLSIMLVTECRAIGSDVTCRTRDHDDDGPTPSTAPLQAKLTTWTPTVRVRGPSRSMSITDCHCPMTSFPSETCRARVSLPRPRWLLWGEPDSIVTFEWLWCLSDKKIVVRWRSARKSRDRNSDRDALGGAPHHREHVRVCVERLLVAAEPLSVSSIA